MESRTYSSNHELELTVTCRESCSFAIYFGKNSIPFGTYSIVANNSLRVSIPWEDVEATGSEVIQDRAIRLIAEKPVNVYALNYDRNSADVAVIYPVSSLGTEYFAMCYEPRVNEKTNGTYGNGRNSEFLVVASEDLTEVKIVPSKITDQLAAAGDTIQIILNKGEVYQVQSMNTNNLTGQGDLTGSFVLSDKPVAFFSGSLATTVPAESGVSAWDHLYEQIPPLPSWGRDYYAVPLKSREQDLYRIMAAKDGTTVYIDGFSPIQLDRGEFEEIILYHNQPRRIYAEKPILVAQYSQSQSVDSDYTGNNGDPFMIILSSSSQSKNDVTFVAYDSDEIEKYFVNVISLTNELSGLQLDGNSIGTEFTPFTNSQYSWAQLEINPGTYRLWNTNEDRGFLAYVYGFGGVESYGYGVGFNLDLVLDLGESIDFSGDTLLLCYGERKVLDAGPYFDFYEWNTGETSAQLTVSEGGKYKVKVGTIDGCELSDSIYVYMSHPVTDLGVDVVEECAPYAIELSGNDGYSAYLWQNEEGDTLSTEQKYTVNSTGTYRVTVVDEYQCSTQDSMELVVFPVPEVELKADSLICGALTAEVTVSISNAAENLWNYPGSFNWSADKTADVSFTDESDESVQVEVAEWGTYKLYYELKTLDGCVKTDSVSVHFHQLPTSSFEFEDNSVCEGYSKKLVFTGQATDSASFYWDLDGCQFLDTIDSNTFVVSVGAFLSRPPYISLSINDNGCLSDTTTLALGAKPNFTMEADPLRGCDQLTAYFSSELLTEDLVDFEWTFHDGEIVSDQTAEKFYDSPGFYSVSLNITNPVTGCRNGFTLDSMVQVFPTPIATIVADPSFCYPDSAEVFCGNSIDSTFCFWSFDGMHQTGGSNDSIQVFLDEPQGLIGLQVEEFGCLSEPVEMTLKRLPHFDFDTDYTEGCQPFSLEITAQAQDDELSFEWFPGTPEAQAGSVLYLSLADSGSYDVQLASFSNQTGCTDTLLKRNWIYVHPKPIAAFDVDYPIATIRHPDLSFTNESELADLYQWDFGDGGFTVETNPEHSYTELGDYNVVLIAESNFGCTDTSSVLIQIIPFDPPTPNAFRPESNIAENTTFMPAGLAVDPANFDLKIYDRWGQILFESHSPDHPWDGNSTSGQAAPMGNYIWISSYVDVQGYYHQQKGQILLIR